MTGLLTLTSVDLPSVDLSAGDAAFTFTVGAMDSGAGVAWVRISFDKPVLQIGLNGAPEPSDFLFFSDWDDSFSDGISSSSVTLSSFTAPGTYSIDSVVVWDNVGNERTYTAAELAAIPGVETSFTVTGSTPDTSKPNLVSLTLPSSVDLTNGAASFDWSAKALDTGAGVEQVFIKFDKPIGQVYSETFEEESEYILVHDFEDSFDDGQSSATVHLSSKNQPGTYSILEVVVRDRAGNEHVYTPNQIASLGGPTSLTLAGPTPTPPVPPALPTTVTTSTDLVLPDGVLNLEAQGKANLKLTGNALGNRISGNEGKNILDGGAGDDILDGRLGKRYADRRPRQGQLPLQHEARHVQDGSKDELRHDQGLHRQG